MRRFSKISQILAVSFLISSLSACSSSSILSSEGLWGASLGTAAGAGAGYLVGDHIGKQTENMALLGGVGAGVGILAGGLLHDENVRSSQQKLAVVREARLIGENQKELDHLRQSMEDATVWGQTEVKPWNERYVTDENSSNTPYQGSSVR